MELKINQEDLINYLSFWHNKSDDECLTLATNKEGLDAEQALTNLLERDLCTDINNEILNELIKFKNK
jgi:hypothetical protein